MNYTRDQITKLQELIEGLSKTTRDYKMELSYIDQLDNRIDDQFTLQLISGIDRAKEIRELRTKHAKATTERNRLSDVIKSESEIIGIMFGGVI